MSGLRRDLSEFVSLVLKDLSVGVRINNGTVNNQTFAMSKSDYMVQVVNLLSSGAQVNLPSVTAAPGKFLLVVNSGGNTNGTLAFRDVNGATSSVVGDLTISSANQALAFNDGKSWTIRNI